MSLGGRNGSVAVYSCMNMHSILLFKPPSLSFPLPFSLPYFLLPLPSIPIFLPSSLPSSLLLFFPLSLLPTLLLSLPSFLLSLPLSLSSPLLSTQSQGQRIAGFLHQITEKQGELASQLDCIEEARKEFDRCKREEELRLKKIQRMEGEIEVSYSHPMQASTLTHAVTFALMSLIKFHTYTNTNLEFQE